MEFYKGWAEWDLGQDDFIFTSHRAFEQWLRAHVEENPIGMTFDEAKDQNLFGSKLVTVITESL